MADSEKLNLYQKLAKIRKLVDIVSKAKSGHNYTYADVNEILAKVKTGMEKYGVSLIPELICDSTQTELQTIIQKKPLAGSITEIPKFEYLVHADMTFTWVDDEDPAQRITVPWHVVGSQADPSQAFGSALTYCTRYFLLNYFQIAQDNDVEQYRKKQIEAEESESVEQASEIIKAFTAAVRMFLSEHPDKEKELIEFTGKYAKGGNYKSIKEPMLAQKMMNDFEEKYLSGK